ncbi:hypothetical protein CW304_29455 [Bacillus sp. UFRGS-B20]|nr:hypothetical protein CW304_29455 [Bacillus sp. UFRGS-B20]
MERISKCFPPSALSRPLNSQDISIVVISLRNSSKFKDKVPLVLRIPIAFPQCVKAWQEIHHK